MTLDTLIENSMKRLREYRVASALPALRFANDGAINDVLNTNGCAYYQWLPGLIEELRPKQVVELGGAMGVASIMMLQSKYQDFELYSITLPEGGLEFSYVKDTYSNFHPIIGNDLDLSNWEKANNPPGKVNPKYFLKETDLWFFDAEHTAEHLQKELDLYSPFFKKGAVVLIDDIRSFGLWPVWEALPYEKREMTDPLHYSGYGVVMI